ncbi:hypothetical protein ABZ566_38915, partial [Streptomyces hygroscopicus]
RAAGARRMAATVPGAPRRLRRGGAPGAPDGLAVLAFAMLPALVVADLPGTSEAETERIRLPFRLWLLPTTALLPAADRRRWLLARADIGRFVNCLHLTGWRRRPM